MNGKQEVVIHVPLLKKSDLPSGIAGSFFHGPGALCIFMGVHSICGPSPHSCQGGNQQWDTLQQLLTAWSMVPSQGGLTELCGPLVVARITNDCSLNLDW